MRRDPLFLDPASDEKHHSHAVVRPSTRKTAPAKTVTDDREGAHAPPTPHRDRFMPPASAISGYDPRLRPAIAAAEALERRNAAAKKGRRK